MALKDGRKIVGVLPGQGWLHRSAVMGAPTPEDYIEPVVGWLVYDDGEAVALRTFHEKGSALPADDRDDFEVFHPDARAQAREPLIAEGVEAAIQAGGEVIARLLKSRPGPESPAADIEVNDEREPHHSAPA
jgi:hypothetical protein